MSTRRRLRKQSIVWFVLFCGVMSSTALASPESAIFQGASGEKVRAVNCSRGETIAKALEKAQPGDTIRITGTCFERVTVTTDRITLDGQGATTLDGVGIPTGELEGVVMIDGAR